MGAGDVVFASNPAAGQAGAPDGVETLGWYENIDRGGDIHSTLAMDGVENLWQITFALEGSDFDPSVDPSGQWLVYSSTQHRKTSDLYIKRVDGTAVTQLTSDPNNDIMPSFSPDGRWIIFASDRSGNWDLYLMDVDGGQPVQLTSDPTDELHPSFSPDGKQVVFSCYGSQSGQWEMVLIDVEKPTRRKFIGYGLFPEWSPVGDQIVFQRPRERETQWFSIWTVSLVGGEASPPTEVVPSVNGGVITPTWSPDGKYIAYTTVMVGPEGSKAGASSQSALWVVKADGTGRAKITQSRFADLQPAWASDGALYFVSNRSEGGRENIWSVRPDRALHLGESRYGAAEASAPEASMSEASMSSSGEESSWPTTQPSSGEEGESVSPVGGLTEAHEPMEEAEH
jgi:TolB protein